MAVDFEIKDGTGTKSKVKVTDLNQLVTAPLAYDDTSFNELAEVNTAYNFFGPQNGQNFIITMIVAYGDKQVTSSTNATVEVYEALADNTTTVSKTLLKFEIGQNQSFTPPRMNLKVTAGRWVNAKTDDDDVHMTIMGYYA